MSSLREGAVGGYVLAGGQSTRMGRDKALMELGGDPLARLAVRKLGRLGLEVHILGNRSELAEFAPLVPDLHPGCGPVGGMEAALAHSRGDWVLLLPVDMPFLPTILLERWMKRVVESAGARASLFIVESVPQPALCLLHRELAPSIQRAAAEGRFKLYPVLREAAAALALKQGRSWDEILLNLEWDDEAAMALSQAPGGDSGCLREAQVEARHLWFANLNTPLEFAEAERHVGALDV